MSKKTIKRENHSINGLLIQHGQLGQRRKRIIGNIVTTERLASAIGNGGLADVGHPIVDGDVLADKRRERDTLLRRVMEPYPFENTL